MTRLASTWTARIATLLFVLGTAVSCLAANTATTPISGDSKRWHDRHEAMNERIKKGNVDLLYIGDSIVQNWKYEEDGKPVWDRYYAKRNAVNLGIGGDRTEHVLWRLTHGNLEGISPKLAIIMIGQNNGPFNTAEEIAEGVKAIVNTVRQKLPKTKILLLGIFYRGEKPNAEQKKLAETNRIIARLADDKTIWYMNINKTFLRPDGTIPKELFPDFEHPSPEGFRLWAEAIEPKVAELMGDQPVAPAAR